jgi:oligoendopeptidase F
MAFVLHLAFTIIFTDISTVEKSKHKEIIMAQNKNTNDSIPIRAELDLKYTWNLADIYPHDDAWDTDLKRAQELIAQAGKYVGRLGESSQMLFDCLETRMELGRTVYNLYQYANLNKDLDNRVSKYQAMTERTMMLSAEAGAVFAFVEPELLTIDEKKLIDMEKEFPKQDCYDFYFRDLIRSKTHVRSQEVEEILAMTTMVANGPDTIFSMLDDADIEYPSIKDENGNDLKLTKQRYAKLMESPHQKLRADANDAFYSVYKAHKNTLGATLATAINKDILYAKARRYESSLHSALDSYNIPVSVYHSLLDTTEANLEGLHEYIALRKKLLKIDKIWPYDLICPLFPEHNDDVPYDDAVTQVLEAVTPLGGKYRQVLADAFSSRWVDVLETEGKGGGAYNSGNYDFHPFVLMNYNNTIDNVFTLAHEMGHALHSHLSSKTQPRQKAQYSIFVAEVASTLNEGLLLEYQLKKTTDKKARLSLLARFLNNTFGTYFNQVLYARFELMIHEHVETGNALSPDFLSELWESLTRKYYGPSISIDEFVKYKWSRIPHFYMTYYVYQYATAFAASQAILTKFLAGEKGIIEKYLTMLSSGGRDYPIELLKICGIDMTTPEPVLATLKLFHESVKEVEKLA